MWGGLTWWGPCPSMNLVSCHRLLSQCAIYWLTYTNNPNLKKYWKNLFVCNVWTASMVVTSPYFKISDSNIITLFGTGQIDDVQVIDLLTTLSCQVIHHHIFPSFPSFLPYVTHSPAATNGPRGLIFWYSAMRGVPLHLYYIHSGQ